MQCLSLAATMEHGDAFGALHRGGEQAPELGLPDGKFEPGCQQPALGAARPSIAVADSGCGFVPHREHSAPSTAVLLALVAAGLGVAVIPASVRALPLHGVVFRDLADSGTIELALAWRHGVDNPVVDAVVALLAAGLVPADGIAITQELS